MKHLVQRLNLSVSIPAIATAIAIFGGMPHTATAQTAEATQTGAPAGTGIETVTVTGTNIKGIAPVGSHVNTVSADEIQALAPANVSDMVNSLPLISQANTITQGANTYSYYSPNIHHLSASNGNSTLVVIDGMRMPGGGEQGLGADPNIIPTLAIQRVEVLADGASSVYGSDAIAGVVNFITRKDFEGLQVDGQIGFAKGFNTENTDLLWGTKWDGGGVYVAASYSIGSSIALHSRPYLEMGNFTSVGGNNQNTYACSAATIRVGASTSAYYLNAASTTTIPGSAGSAQAAAPCNNENMLDPDLVPSSDRLNVMMHAHQSFLGGRLEITNDTVLNNLHTQAFGSVGTVTATVYGTGAQANPFFQAPAGNPSATSETISWADTNTTKRPEAFTSEDTLYNKFNATYNFTDTWRVTMDWAAGLNVTNDSIVNEFCAACAYLALNGTAQSSGSTTATDIGGENVVALNLPLTTSNALDVWSPVGSNRTNSLVLNKLYFNQNEYNVFNATSQLRMETDAALFDLPGGTVHAAIGGEYYIQHVTRDVAGPTATGPGAVSSYFIHDTFQRNALSEFAELQIPVISPEMNIPLVEALSFDLSFRYDHFSDVGQSGNPKYSADWEVTDGFKVRSNYSTSFVAPPLISLGDAAYGYASSSNVGASGPVGASVAGQTNNLSVAQFPLAAAVPGAVCTGTTTPASSGCPYVTLGQINGVNGDQGLSQTLGGGAINPKPTTGINWTLGFDYTPDYIPGLSVSTTWWNTTIKGENKSTSGFANPAFASGVIFCTPANGYATGCPASVINQFAHVAQGAFLGALPAGPVWYLNPGYQADSLYVRGSGIDFDGNYAYDAGSLGILKVGDFLSLITRFELGISGHQYSSILGQGSNGNTISALSYTNRSSFGWVKDSWAVDFWVNYTPGYHNTTATAVNVVTSNPSTGFANTESGDIVKSNTTVDMNVAYTFADGILNGDQLYVHGINVFNVRPPFFSGNIGGIGAQSSAFGYNPLVSSPLGREISVGLRAKF